MNIRHTKQIEQLELPIELLISFEKVLETYERFAAPEAADHPFHKSAKIMVREIKKYPELIDGFSDTSLLEKHQEHIELLLEPLFPEALLNNEIKAATIPFSFTSFKFTTRFEKILNNAGADFELTLRNFEEDLLYIMSCSMILGQVYGYHIDLKRPFYFDIPDQQAGITRHYRAALNGDFGQIIPTEKAPPITEEDYRILLDNFHNIDVWKEKFPPNSYIYKGFGIMNLFDVTVDESITNIRTNLLRSGENLIEELQNNLREFFNIKDLMLGYSVYDLTKKTSNCVRTKVSESLLLNEQELPCPEEFFCQKGLETLFNDKETFAVSDTEKYGRLSNKNPLYHQLVKKGIGSILMIPIHSGSTDLALLEIASPRPFELNSINQNKLKDIIPVFEAAIKRSAEEYQNTLEATIQKHYTSIHPSVKWRFNEAAIKYQQQQQSGDLNPKADQIYFDEVYPLYGQADIKGSSIARNLAIKDDLMTQLQLAIKVLKEACKTEELPIYEELMFRVENYLGNIRNGLQAGDEVGIIDFLKKEIYPVFHHIKSINESLAQQVSTYMDRLDPTLQVVYDKRKKYEDAVNLVNNKLTLFLDQKQEEAQAMFPHYFERYKTDGVDYNMYIGQSLVQDKTFDKLYLYNLRLWQLKMMYEMENIAHQAKQEMEHPLDITSLILVHSNPISIKFRMDEKQFDVEGAYNIRYEIIKKRIDKSYIKGTQERLTQPGKIAIVYSQEKDALEYLKYIKFLQSKGLLGTIEQLDIEDLQGVSGLKALRVQVIYQDNTSKKGLSYEELMSSMQQKNN